MRLSCTLVNARLLCSSPNQIFCNQTFCSLSTFSFVPLVSAQVDKRPSSMAPSLIPDLAHIEEVKLQRFQGGRASLYFASVILGIVLIYASAHWLRLVQRRRQPRYASSVKASSTWSTSLQKSLYGRKIYGQHVLPDRVALAVVYFGVNAGVSVWDIDWHHYTTFANRLGW